MCRKRGPNGEVFSGALLRSIPFGQLSQLTIRSEPPTGKGRRVAVGVGRQDVGAGFERQTRDALPQFLRVFFCVFSCLSFSFVVSVVCLGL